MNTYDENDELIERLSPDKERLIRMENAVATVIKGLEDIRDDRSESDSIHNFMAVAECIGILIILVTGGCFYLLLL